MLNIKIIQLACRQQITRKNVARCFHHEFIKPEPQQSVEENKNKPKQPDDQRPKPLPKPLVPVPGGLRHKYSKFRDEDASEIFDVEEEKERFMIQDAQEYDVRNDLYMGLNLNRGINGVFDVEDLVDVLRKESAEDIFVCSVPKDLKYVDYMVVCSGRSYRHMLAMAEFVRRMYKVKRNKNDILPKIEGEKSRDWMAMDLGNIALHIFTPQAREQYDLESLWAIGAEYDKECNKPQDAIVELFEKHSILFEGINPPKG